MKLRTPKRFAWLAAFACVGCCALIPILAAFGVVGAIGLSAYFELTAANA